MSWDEFTACAGRDGEILADLGEDAVKDVWQVWRSLPVDVKAALISAAGASGRYQVAALAAVGVAAADAIAVVAASVGLGVLMGIIADCYDKL